MAAKTTLLLRESLLLLTFGTATIHFTTTQVILKEQTAARTFACSWLNRSTTAWNWTFKNGLAVTAPLLAFKGFLTFLTSLNGHHSLQYI